METKFKHVFPSRVGFLVSWQANAIIKKECPCRQWQGRKYSKVADVPTSFPRGCVVNAIWAGDLAHQRAFSIE
jgi:hypothetical protein